MNVHWMSTCKYFLLISSLLLFATNCSFKTIVQPYPPAQLERILDEQYKIKIQFRNGDYSLINSIQPDTLSLNYQPGELRITEGNITEWSKVDYFFNPIDSSDFYLDSFAFFDVKSQRDELITDLYTRSDSLISSFSGLPEWTDITYKGQALTIRMEDSWMDGYTRTEENGERYYYHYPFGGEFTLYEGTVKLVSVIQGGVVDKALGMDSYQGTEYTVLFRQLPNSGNINDIINILMTYFSFVDLNFYYSECDYNSPVNDGSCPGVIVIR